jgi:hypothetical protein
MSTIINGTSNAITFPDGSIQNTSAIVSGKVPYTNLPAGSVLQTVQGYTTTAITTTSGSQVDTNCSASITPKSASSKILVILSFNGYVSSGSGVTFGDMYSYMVRGSTTIASSRTAINFGVSTWSDTIFAQQCLVYLDSPATTSSTTYKLQVAVSNGLPLTVPFQSFGSMTLMEIAG